MKTVLTLLLLMIISTPVFSGKLYKWVDKQGTVHYTQTPPPETQSREKAREMKVQTTTIRPEKKRGKYYCGEDELPRLKQSAAANITNLQNSIYGWEDSIERRKKQRSDTMKRNSYNSKYSSNAMAQYNKDDDEDRCKITWAKSQLKSLDGEKEKIIERYHTVTKAVKDVEDRKLSECGSDNRTGFIEVDEAYQKQIRCNQKYDREIRKLKKEMKNAKRNYDLVEK